MAEKKFCRYAQLLYLCTKLCMLMDFCNNFIFSTKIERSNKVGEFLVDFPDGVPAIENVPTSLKATLYDQYYRFGGNKDGFVEYLMTYLSDAE